MSVSQLAALYRIVGSFRKVLNFVFFVGILVDAKVKTAKFRTCEKFN